MTLRWDLAEGYGDVVLLSTVIVEELVMLLNLCAARVRTLRRPPFGASLTGTPDHIHRSMALL